MPNIKGPDGKVISFPEGTSDADIASAFSGISASASDNPAASQGFFGSLANSSGLSGLGNAIAHPIDTIAGIPSAIAGEGKRIAGEVSQGVQDYQKGGLSETTRRDFGRAVPIFGPALAAAQAQHDAGNNAGMAGTLAGTVGGFVGPEIAAKGIGLAAKGAGTALKVASADAPSLKLATTRALTKGTPGELLQAALKPGVKYGAGADEMLQNSIPHVIAAEPALKGVSGYASASEAAKNAAFQPYNDLLSPYRAPQGGAIGPFRPSAIDASPIADAQLRSIPTMDLIEKPNTTSPLRSKKIEVPAGEGGTTILGSSTGGEANGGILNKTADVASNYRRDFSVPTLDAVRGDANAKLNAFYNRAGGDQAAALSNPETARVKAVGDTTRDVLYPQLEKGAGLPEGSVADMQKKYGLLADVSDIANKRDPVFSRHDPVTLGQKVAMSAGSNPLTTATKFMTQKMLDKITNSDALVNSAIDRYRNPLGTPLVSRPNMLPRAATSLGEFLQSNPIIDSMAKFPLNGTPKLKKSN